jgi:hypothetical protein
MVEMLDEVGLTTKVPSKTLHLLESLIPLSSDRQGFKRSSLTSLPALLTEELKELSQMFNLRVQEAKKSRLLEREQALLPEGWEIRVTNTSRAYYVDHNTKTTTWDSPIDKLTDRPKNKFSTGPEIKQRKKEKNKCMMKEDAKDLAGYQMCLNTFKAALAKHELHSEEESTSERR